GIPSGDPGLSRPNYVLRSSGNAYKPEESLISSTRSFSDILQANQTQIILGAGLLIFLLIARRG
ncbi:MAG: hypothetical protein ACRERV_13035, partial [Methylococcales bacterium]